MLENPHMTTMTEIQCFSHTLHNRDISVSAVMLNGEPWFRAKDVATALGYVNPRQAVRHNVDEQDRSQLKDLVLRYHDEGEHVEQQLTYNEGAQVFVSEFGMYALILASQKPEAKAMHRWVMTEVLPNIRKHMTILVEPRAHKEACRTRDC